MTTMGIVDRCKFDCSDAVYCHKVTVSLVENDIHNNCVPEAAGAVDRRRMPARDLLESRARSVPMRRQSHETSSN